MEVGMEQWKERLAGVDDDYLIGISNKGILKRAYKDKEEITAVVEGVGEEASVKVGEETVTICFPLGESKCTCPSRSICRHVVQAILVFKESCCQGDGEQGNAAEEEKTDGASNTQGQDAGAQNDGQSAAPEGEVQKTAERSDETDTSSNTTKVCQEIEQFPLAQLKKILGNRQLQILHNQYLSQVRPKIQYSSIVTVQLPEQGMTVKLLSPLEYSSCTCHKKEMCTHKASAILWCQLVAGTVQKEELALEAAETTAFRMDKAKEAAGQMKEFLEELLCTGLSRTSPDVPDYLERLAIISHNGGLAKFEGYFRSLADAYGGYFKRKAQFRTDELMEQITRLYKRVRLLEDAIRAGDNKEVLKHAGEFRADYIPVGNLDLIGITMEEFQTQTGYEGETIYFLEENTKQWYTYTNARPMFYEGRSRRHMEKSPAPWGVNVAIEDLSKVRIKLKGARCDTRKRLSSSQETKGEIMGERGLEKSDIENWYYEDFEKLFSERIEKPREQWLYGQDELQKGVDLIFVQPAFCVKADFSRTQQKLAMPIYDKSGREIVIELPYSKRDSAAIRYLEKISEKEPSCFLGKIYLRDGRIRMYPVMVLKRF